jgi:hypothetical protein
LGALATMPFEIGRYYPPLGSDRHSLDFQSEVVRRAREGNVCRVRRDEFRLANVRQRDFRPFPHGEHRAIDAFRPAAGDVAAAGRAAIEYLGAHGHDVIFDLRSRRLQSGEDGIESLESVEGLIAEPPRLRHEMVAIGKAMHAEGAV